jgi:hypothetical protein
MTPSTEPVKLYPFRELPKANRNIAILGIYRQPGYVSAGALEWCDDQADAETQLEKMKQPPLGAVFEGLHIRKYL